MLSRIGECPARAVDLLRPCRTATLRFSASLSTNTGSARGARRHSGRCPSRPLFLVAEIYVYTYTPAMKHSDGTQLLHRIAQIQHMGTRQALRHAPRPQRALSQPAMAGGRKRPSAAMCLVIRWQAVAQNTANYEQFQALVAQYAQLVIQQNPCEPDHGLKKKTSPPRSSWPKTRKSSS